MQTVKMKDDTINQVLEFPGIVSVKLKHKISSTELDYDYAGPKIPYEEWHKVLSFFRWTYQEAHSESQVRGFIDPTTNKILFWAFPQEAGTGMTTKELDGDEFNQQRAALPNANELIYFFTIHHHCSAGAFQSGGDSNNEERPGGRAHETGQDGLHITVGLMDKARHDMHARLYLKGVKMQPRFSDFWDISDSLKVMLPNTLHDNVAYYQMTEKVELEFPQKWKDNYIKVERKVTTYVTPDYYGGGYSGYTSGKSLTERIEASAAEVVETLMDNPKFDVPIEILQQVLDFLQESPIIDEILDEAMKERYDAIDIRSLVKNMETIADDWVEIEAERALAIEKGEKVDIAVKRGKRKKNGKGTIVAGNESDQPKSVADQQAQQAREPDKESSPLGANAAWD